eukprot:778723-Pyramimonas_sp.AAC.1
MRRCGQVELAEAMIGCHRYNYDDVKHFIMGLLSIEGGPTLQVHAGGPPVGAIAETWELAIDLVVAPPRQVSNAPQALGAAPQSVKD